MVFIAAGIRKKEGHLCQTYLKEWKITYHTLSLACVVLFQMWSWPMLGFIDKMWVMWDFAQVDQWNISWCTATLRRWKGVSPWPSPTCPSQRQHPLERSRSIWCTITTSSERTSEWRVTVLTQFSHVFCHGRLEIPRDE